MKAKRFKEWIRESREAKVEWDGAKRWFDSETDFRELLSDGVWQFRLDAISESEILALIEQFARDLEVDAKPILLTWNGGSIYTLFFSVNKPIKLDEVHSWFYRLDGVTDKSADLFKSNATIVDRIITRFGKELTSEQLMQLAEWITGHGLNLNPDWVETVTREIKSQPNWPEDTTDWTLGDW